MNRELPSPSGDQDPTIMSLQFDPTLPGRDAVLDLYGQAVSARLVPGTNTVRVPLGDAGALDVTLQGVREASNPLTEMPAVEIDLAELDELEKLHATALANFMTASAEQRRRDKLARQTGNSPSRARRATKALSKVATVGALAGVVWTTTYDIGEIEGQGGPCEARVEGPLAWVIGPLRDAVCQNPQDGSELPPYKNRLDPGSPFTAPTNHSGDDHIAYP